MAVGNAGARGAGDWGPFAEGECEASFSKDQARDHLGFQLGMGQILCLGRELRSDVMDSHESLSENLLGSWFRNLTPGRAPRGAGCLAGWASVNPLLPFRAPSRLVPALRAAPPQDCPETPWSCLCRSRRPGWSSAWADSTGSWSL